MTRRFALSFAVFVALVSAALAQSFPALSGRVVDTAALLDAGQEARLVSKLAAHETKSGQQVVVATIPDLGGRDIEGYANGLFREWGLGDKERNDGVLFLVARDDRKLRIEVGYGLEGTLTDALSAYIIRTEIVPAFRQGNFALGIERGSDAILDVLASDAAALEDWQSRARPKKRDSGGIDPIGVVFVTIWVLLFFGPMVFMWLVKKFGTKIAPNKYRWLGQEFVFSKAGRIRSSDGGWSMGGGGYRGGGGWSSGGGGFGGGGGSSGGGGASGSW